MRFIKQHPLYCSVDWRSCDQNSSAIENVDRETRIITGMRLVHWDIECLNKVQR
jgi:hypothetical protein